MTSQDERKAVLPAPGGLRIAPEPSQRARELAAQITGSRTLPTAAPVETREEGNHDG